MAQRTMQDRYARDMRAIAIARRAFLAYEQRSYEQAIKSTAEHAAPDYWPDAAEQIAARHGKSAKATLILIQSAGAN